jgi:hypothetical protein
VAYARGAGRALWYYCMVGSVYHLMILRCWGRVLVCPSHEYLALNSRNDKAFLLLVVVTTMLFCCGFVVSQI